MRSVCEACVKSETLKLESEHKEEEEGRRQWRGEQGSWNRYRVVHVSAFIIILPTEIRRSGCNYPPWWGPHQLQRHSDKRSTKYHVCVCFTSTNVNINCHVSNVPLATWHLSTLQETAIYAMAYTW